MPARSVASPMPATKTARARTTWQVFRCYRRVAAGQAVHQTTGSIRGETRVQALLAQRRSRQGRVTRRGAAAAGTAYRLGAPDGRDRRLADGGSVNRGGTR